MVKNWLKQLQVLIDIVLNMNHFDCSFKKSKKKCIFSHFLWKDEKDWNCESSLAMSGYMLYDYL